MLEGIIPKEYPVDRTDSMDATVISQQDQTKDLEEKQPFLADLQGLLDSWDSR